VIDPAYLQILSAFLFACSGVIFVYGYIKGRRTYALARRLDIDLAPPGLPGTSEESISETADQLVQAAGLRRLRSSYAPLLVRAGVYFPGAPRWFLAGKVFALAAALPFMALVFPAPDSALGYLLRVVGGGAVVWFLPDLILRSIADERRARLMRGLPEWLDLHTTLVEGGMGFDAALVRITSETQVSKEPIFQELSFVQKEITMGSDRLVALRRMAQRTQVEELDQVVAALVQADRLGAGIAIALRAQSDMLRNKIWEDARTRAEKLPTKLLFPIVIGFLPMFFALVVFPMLLRIISTLKGGR
jgi:tight adherence protein C